MLLSVIIPVYNEEKTIESVIKKIREVDLSDGLHKQIIIVDDASKDATPFILEKYKTSSDIKIFTHTKNSGKTAALVRGLQEASGDILLIQDADLEYPPSAFPSLLDPILKGETDIVYGSRFMGSFDGMTTVNCLSNRFSNITFNFLYGQKLTDINTCYKVFKRGVLNGIEIRSQHFAFETEITAKFVRKGHKILEIPIPYQARTNSQGKKMNWLAAIHMYWGIFRYRF